MKTLYFVRHGQTEWNAIARMQGQWNSDLNELGRAQADVNGQFLQHCGIEQCYVSPLDRTRQTAEIINQYLDLDLEFDDRIKEWHCGDWSGEMYADVKVRWKTEWDAWQADPFNYRGPNAENYTDMQNRVLPFLDRLLTDPADNIAIVSHGLIGRVMIALLLELSQEDTLSFHQPNDVIFRLTEVGAGTDAQRFFTEYFEGGKGPYEGFPTRV